MSGSTVLLCVAVMFLWGSGPVFDKIALRHVDSKILFVARFYLMFLILLTPMVLQFGEVRAQLAPLDRRVLGALAGSVALPLLGLYCYYRALGQAEASKVVPLCGSYPLAAALLAVLVLGESMTLPKIAGTFLVVAGATLLARA